MIDNSGRLFGKISLLDIFIILAAAALFIGFLYNQISEQAGVFTAPTEVFYVTFESNGLRPVNIASIDVGDRVFRLFENSPFGTVAYIDTVEPATYLLARSDGTAVHAVMEGRYRLVYTVRVLGNITSIGYFVNGNDHVAVGSIIVIVSNRAYFPESVITQIRRSHESHD